MKKQINKKRKTVIYLAIILCAVVFLSIFYSKEKQKIVLEQITSEERLENERKLSEKEIENVKKKAEQEEMRKEMEKYLVSPTLYQNDELGIKIKAIDGWTIEVFNGTIRKENQLGFYVFKPDKQENCGQDGYCADVFHFGIEENKGGEKLEDYLKNKNKESKPIFIQDKKMYLTENASAFDGSLSRSYWKDLGKNKFFYISETYLNEEQKKDFEKTVNNIIFY